MKSSQSHFKLLLPSSVLVHSCPIATVVTKVCKYFYEFVIDLLISNATSDNFKPHCALLAQQPPAVINKLFRT